MSAHGDLGQQAARLVWACDSNDWQRITWAEAEKHLGLARVKFRTSARTYKKNHPEEFKRPGPQLTRSDGVTPGMEMPDPEEVFERACYEWERTDRLVHTRNQQRLVFDYGPIALAWTADWHLGGSGVDYPRLDRELHIIADTPGMYALGGGDLVNTMIVGNLVWARLNDRLAIRDEWVLLLREVGIIAPKLLAAVMGNHGNWVEELTGISFLERELRALKPSIIYDRHDAIIQIQVGDWEIPLRIRHKWTGSSIYNPTHGIERAAKWDHNFVVGMGAHTHVSGLTREFNIDGITGIAMIAGSYKRNDEYARKGGFPYPNNSTSVAVVIDERNRSLTGFGDLQTCADYMDAIYE